MALDLGDLLATAHLDIRQFMGSAAKVDAELRRLAISMDGAAGDTRVLDEALIRTSASADDAAAATKRSTTATTQNAGASKRGAAASKALADADARRVEFLRSIAAESTRVQRAMLQQAAAQERGAIATGQGSREYARMMSAQASLIGATRRLEQAHAASAERMVATGRKMTSAITGPAALIAGAGVYEAMKYQKAMTLIQTAGGETAAKAAAISAGIKRVAVQTGTDLDQLTDGIYVIAKAGARKWSAAQQLEVLRAAAQGAKAEAVPLGTAVDALSTIMLDYGAKASDAVKYQDMLIRGAGLAKTTMQQYAGSLSNVVPVAAAAGLNFKQVAGAIATMTQHGVSADRATENLRNLIFNLSGQNSVASAAMQQLGIDTVDLTQKLGQRGLTGTLKIVDAALAAHTHDGMVTSDVHKAAALATKSLNEEMGTFSGKLKAQSAGLLAGKVGISDYTKYAKSLGGAAGAGALQFLSLYKNSLGFSNQLKSGQGTVTTSTQQMQKMFGGMTGASVAMQIAGKYAKQTADNTRDVGKVALEAGSDVLGWNKTQDTLSVKMDKAKASLQVMAVEIGTALIPTVTKMVGVVRDGVDWFEHLSGTQKEVLGWGVGVMAGLGPLMTIGGRLALVGRGINGFVSGTTRQLTRLAGVSEERAATISLSMSRVSAALGGAGIGLAIGTMTKNASTGAKALGLLGSTAAGAAIGFGAGGGVGALIGGAAGAISDLVSSFNHEGDSAQAAAAEAKRALMVQNDAANTLLNTLQGVNGAYGKQYRSQLISNLNSGGILAAANRMHLDLGKVVNAAITGGDYFTKHIDPYGKLADTWNAVAGGAANAEQKYELFQKAQGKGVVTAKQLTQGLHALNSEFQKGAGRYLTTSGPAKAPTRPTEEMVQGNGTVKVPGLGQFQNLNDAMAKYNKQEQSYLDATSAAAQRNTAVIQANLGYIAKQAQAQLDHGRSIAAVTKYWEGNTSALQANLVKMGFSQAAVTKLFGSLAKPPPAIEPQVKLDQAEEQADSLQHRIDAIKQGKVPSLQADPARAQQVLAGLQSRLNSLRQNVIPKISIDTTNAMLSLNQIRSEIHNLGNGNYSLQSNGTATGASLGFARGGTVPPNTTATVGERGWELLRTDSSGRAHIASHEQSRALTGWPARLPGYANGTGLLGYATGAGFRGQAARTAAAIAEAESGGDAHAHNSVPPDNSYGLWQINMIGGLGPARRTQFHLASNDALYNPAVNARVAYALSNHGTNFSPWTTYTSGAYRQFLGDDGSVSHGGGAGSGSAPGAGTSARAAAAAHVNGKRYGGVTYSSHQAAVNAAYRDARSAAVSHASSALSNINLDKTSFRYARYTDQVSKATKALQAAIDAGATHSEIASLQGRLARAEKRAAKLEHGLQVQATHAYGGLTSMLGNTLHVGKLGGLSGSTATVGDVRGQLNSLQGLLSRAGVSRADIKSLSGEDDAILADVRRRDKDAAVVERDHAALVKARAKETGDYKAFRSARMGGFDITSAGADPVTGKVTKGSILAQQGQYISRLKEWNKDLHHLAGLIPDSYYLRLEGEDPDTALPELRALMAMNPKQLKTLRTQAGEISTLSTQGAKFGATTLDQHAINVARQQERTDAKTMRQDQHQLHEDLKNLKDAIDKFTIHGLKAGDTVHIDFKKGTLVFAQKRDQQHVATNHRGR